MNAITQFKNAIALIVIAGAIIFIGDIVTAASPEVVTPDVVSPEVVTPDVQGRRVITPGRAIVAYFNGDLHPDFVLYNHSTRQTAIWYMNNNVHIGSPFWSNHSNRLGPRVCGGFQRRQSYRLCTVQFDSTGQTLFNYMSGPTLIGSGSGPTLPSGWELVATDDFNLDGFADYVLYNPSSHQTRIWYLHNNNRIGTASWTYSSDGLEIGGCRGF